MPEYNNLTDYLIAKNIFEGTRWKCTSEGNFAMVNGQWIDEQTYYQHNSKPTYVKPQKENPDTTKIQ